MLTAGEIDAAIFGHDVPPDPAFRPVFPDPAAAAEDFRTRYGCVPVNHLAVVRRDRLEHHPEVAAELLRLFAAAGVPTGRATLWPAIALASRWSAEQGLIERPLTEAEVWEGLPAGVG